MQTWKKLIVGFILTGGMLSSVAQVSFNVNISPNRGHSRLVCWGQDTIFLSASVPSQYDTIYWTTNPFTFSAGGVTDTFFIPTLLSNIQIFLYAIDTNVTPHDTAIAMEVVNIINEPNQTINVYPQTNVCVGTEVKFEGFFPNVVDSFWWVIDNNVFNNGDPEQSYNYSSVGTDTVLLIASNVCGVDTSAIVMSILNNISPGGIFPIASPSQACPGTPVKLFAGPPGLRNAYDLTWDFGDGSPTVSGHISNVKEVVHYYSVPGSYTASLIVKWEGGSCPNDSSILTVPINVNPTYNPAFANIISLDSGCVNTQFYFYLNIGSPENIDYVMWDMGDGSVYFTASSPFSISHLYTAPGTYNVTAIVHSYCGDTMHVNKTIKVKTSGISGYYIPGVFTSSNLLCLNEEFYVYVSSSFTDSIIISFNGVSDTFFASTVLDTLIASATPGYDTVFVHFRNPCGEWDSTFVIVRVVSESPAITMNIYTTSNNYCVGDSVKVDISIGSMVALDTLYVDYGDGTIDTLLPMNNYISTYHVYSSPGQYVISATAVKNCMNLRQTVYEYIVIDNNIGPNAQISVFPTHVCAGEPIFLYAWGTFLPDEESAYMWDFGDGNTGTGSSAQHTYTDGGTYDITLYTSACGKTDTTTVSVRVIGAPAYGINASSTAVCVGNSVTFNAVQLGSIAANELVWSFGDGTVDSGASVTHTFNIPGSYNVILMAVGDSCSSQQSMSIVVTPNVPPTANFVYNYMGNGTTQFFNLSTNATSFIWYFGDGDSSSASNPVHTYTANGTYTITLIAINPCGFADTFTQTITITDLSTVDVDIAQSVTTIIIYPNPVNEFLRIQLAGVSSLPLLLTVRDLTGKSILSQTITEGTATINTSSLPVGTYIGELISLKNKDIIWKGKIVKSGF